MAFVVAIGVANLFADLTYEGARSINGQFLARLGASAGVVGLTAGFGELVGYGLRSLTGLFADRTRRYWAVTILGLESRDEARLAELRPTSPQR